MTTSLNNSPSTYVSKDNVKFAGVHLLVDLWGCTNLNNPNEIKQLLKACSKASNATYLHSYMHPFEPHGVSGVVVLAESHISIHTWPERAYAAIDLFMCGDADPYLAIPLLKDYFKPSSIQINEQKRGIEI